MVVKSEGLTKSHQYINHQILSNTIFSHPPSKATSAQKLKSISHYGFNTNTRTTHNKGQDDSATGRVIHLLTFLDPALVIRILRTRVRQQELNLHLVTAADKRNVITRFLTQGLVIL